MRCLDGRLVKGYIGDFLPSDETVSLEDESSRTLTFAVDDLKAIFFVKTYIGDKDHVERKVFSDPISLGKRIFVKFKDGECMTGYIEGDIPWGKGFFLEPKRSSGFFLVPVDDKSNNRRVFVVASSVLAVTVMG
ncbi:MAG: hypothetical protein M1497_10815 [Nitrospirae bacterium]|nr:hypothetical protein [Nitrospirota bacterium]